MFDHSVQMSYTFLDGCKSVCGKYGSLWPRPTRETDIGSRLAVFHIDDLAVKFDTSHLISIEVTSKIKIFTQDFITDFENLIFNNSYPVLLQEDVIEHLELILSDAWIAFTEYLRQMIDNLKKRRPAPSMLSQRYPNQHFDR